MLTLHALLLLLLFISYILTFHKLNMVAAAILDFQG